MRLLPPSAPDFAQLVAVIPTRADAVVVAISDAVDVCIAQEAHLAGHNEEALSVLERALALRETLGQPELVGENLHRIFQLAWWTGRADQAREATSRAVELLEARPASPEVAIAAYHAQAQAAFRIHDLTGAAVWADRARDLAEQLGDEDLITHVSVTALTSRLAAGDPAAWSSLEEIHRQAAADGLVDPAARALGTLASVVADELAQYDEAAPLVERALAFSAQHDLER